MRCRHALMFSVLPSLALLAGCPAPAQTSDSATEGSSGSTIDSTGSTDGTGSTGSTGETDAISCECGASEACIDGACVEVDRQAIEAGCHPLHEAGNCLYPWPSDFTTVPDQTATGLRVAMNPALLPVNDAGLEFAADEIINLMDGFTPHAQLRFVTRKGVMAEDLAGLDAIADSLADDAKIVLLRDDGMRWPTFAEVDARTDDLSRKAVFIRPMRRLDFGSRYIVAVRGLRDAGGAPVLPSPIFRALRDDLPTDMPEVEALRPGYEALFADLEAAGIARDELILAWDFTTASEGLVKRDAEALVPQIEALAGAGNLGYTIDKVDDSDGAVARVIRGTFNVPNCMTGQAEPGEFLRRDDKGLPVCEGVVEAPFVAAIPRKIFDAGQPAPIAVYGHGLLGSADEVIGVAEKASELVLIGTDWWGMSESDLINIANLLGANFKDGRALPERLMQSTINFSALGYLATGDLAGDPALMKDGAPLLDTSVVHYIGGSQGGIMGGTTVALAPNLDRGVLVVGGANYSQMIWRSTAFNGVNSLWVGFHKDEIEREFLMALFQTAFDLADPVIYAEEIREAPFEGNNQKQLLLVESIGDVQVPNISTEMMARSYGMKMIGAPIYEVFDVPTVAEVDDVALLQVDTKPAFLPPTENLPADEDNGAHGKSADGPGIQDTIAYFLLGGSLASQCDGVCDPD
ncbi:MAG: hypothetical protein H6710_22880 [Myxococcales bacterium]|nr:hypothetical protein [Myxococcales bacterium]